ncbi:MAG: DUF262 domain-containing protein [Ignavibacteria bacterium]|nr:DUF262 domain-containing protein [Ignavibacteria bacterium]
MAEIQLNYSQIQEIFKNHLKVENGVKSIEALFANKRLESKIVYDPYYQRNYVWDDNKGTYFVESILLGTEIPPLVLFNNGSKIEIIDGRQRYETIKRFIDKEFKLTKNGLYQLKFLAKKDFDNLDKRIKEIFWDTKLRFIEFSVVNEPKLDDNKEDLIKKEIFRRYNSGITPLKKPEIEKAIYINDDLTQHIKEQFRKNRKFYEKVIVLLFSEKEKDNINKPIALENTLSKIRKLLVINNIPIKRYSVLHGRDEFLSKFYEIFVEDLEDIVDFYKELEIKFDLCHKLKLSFKNKELSNNRLIYEVFFWALTVLEKEKVNLEKIDNKLISKFSTFISDNEVSFSTENSHFYKNVIDRYTKVARFFEKEFDCSFKYYLDDYTLFQEKISEINKGNKGIDALDKLENLRLNKPEPSTNTIEDICRLMNRDRFLVRPIYQRGEVINKIKSSALIESIILGIKLPPIFVFKRKDGICEVVDGQQRLLSIIGFIGEEFLDENGNRVKSEKNKFKLNKLTILNELEGLPFEKIAPEFKDKLLDFNIPIVFIDEKQNPSFDNIDLFIRLNNKPYPIKENSFEMWNSYIDKEIISQVKTNTKKHSSWFHIRTEDYNKRMDNEETYITLSFLEYIKEHHDLEKVLNIYQRENNINLRIKDKSEITKLLNLVSLSDIEKKKFIRSVGNIESFIKKVKAIIIDKDIDELNEYLKSELNKIFHIKSNKRTTQSFYTLWYIINDLNLEMINFYRNDIKNDLKEIFNFTRNGDKISKFHELIKSFKNKYKKNDRKTFLKEDEKKRLIKKQNNKCFICGGELYYGDDIEVDHINPLAVGGRDGFLNLQIVHKNCNRKKGKKLIT